MKEDEQGCALMKEENPEVKERIPQEGVENSRISFPLFFTESCQPSNNFLWAILDGFGILFTKNALQNVLQGISAERTRIVNRVQVPCNGTAERVVEFGISCNSGWAIKSPIMSAWR